MRNWVESTFEAVEPLPDATLEAVTAWHRKPGRTEYDPRYTDIAVVKSLGIAVPVVNFNSMSRLNKEQPTVNGYSKIHSLWWGIDLHVSEYHATKRPRQLHNKPCACPLCAYIERPRQQADVLQHHRAFLPQTLEEFLPLLSADLNRYKRIGTSTIRVATLAEYMQIAKQPPIAGPA